MLHVNFKKTDCDSELGLVGVLLDVLKYVVHGSRDDSGLVCQVVVGLAAENSVSFSTASLAVSHNYPIKPIKDVLGHWFCQTVICLVLVLLYIQHLVKFKVSLFNVLLYQVQRLKVTSCFDAGYLAAVLLLLVFDERSHAHNH